MLVGNLHSVALIDLGALFHTPIAGWEPSFCSLDRLIKIKRVRSGCLVIAEWVPGSSLAAVA
ncbi:MAG: hypothetical protein ACFNL3_07390, partial [Rothia aeria]